MRNAVRNTGHSVRTSSKVTISLRWSGSTGTSRRFTTGDGGASLVARSFKGKVSVKRQPGADVDLNAGGQGGIR